MRDEVKTNHFIGKLKAIEFRQQKQQTEWWICV